MSNYKKPKRRLHRDFVYLDYNSVINSLSAFEAGKVDEIIEKTSEATDKGLEGGLGKGSTKVSGNRKKQAAIQEELVRKRTWFSAFESWYDVMRNEDAIGRFDKWDLDVRTELEVGDTLEFTADVRLSPIHLIFATFSSYAQELNKPGSVFQASTREVTEARNTARTMEKWIAGRDGSRRTTIYLAPGGQPTPRIVGRVDDPYVLAGLDALQGRFTVLAQVDTILNEGEAVAAVRIIRDVPSTPAETRVASEALSHFKEYAPELGLELTDEDITLSHPAVIVQPLAIFK